MVPHPEARPIGKVYSEEALEQLLANASRTAAEAMRERAAKHVEEVWDHGDLIAAAIRALEIEGDAK